MTLSFRFWQRSTPLEGFKLVMYNFLCWFNYDKLQLVGKIYPKQTWPGSYDHHQWQLPPPTDVQWVKKIPPPGDYFFHKRLRICNRFFTHILNVPIFARLQIFIQLSPILTKLCHIKRDYPVHIICAKCPKRAKMRAFRRLRKSLTALLIVVCGKSL